MKLHPLLFLALLATLAACTQPEPQKIAVKVVKTLRPVVIGDKTLANVYAHYTRLKDALTRSDSVTAKVAADSLSSSLAKLPGCSGAVQMAKKLHSSARLDAQRTQFVKINAEIIPVFKQTPLVSGQIYVEYCPMADNSKGASWLSSERKVRNPYFGGEMLECGEVKSIIK